MPQSRTHSILQKALAPPTMIVLARDGGAETGISETLTAIGPAARIILLAVEPEPETVRTRGIMKTTVDRQLGADAEARLQPISRQLTSAGVDCHAEVLLSERPQTILDVARKHGCKTIVVPCRPLAGTRCRWLSVTGCVGHHIGARLAALSNIPVIVLPIRMGKR
jgi:nucleotide-binding universal stress UspA family protein